MPDDSSNQPPDDFHHDAETIPDSDPAAPDPNETVPYDLPDPNATVVDEASDFPKIDGYRITGKLGEGGMGSVWRAVQISTDREVALKLMRHIAMTERARTRFEREVKLVARLEHTNIATVYASGLHKGVYFYAMDLVDGVPLDRFVQNNRLKQDHILKLMRIICNAVHHAHKEGIVHRDLKPDNILVTKQGRPVILDFGLALADDDNEDTRLTQAGDIAGTPAYMAPEQAAGRPDDICPQTDVFALGAILYRLLIGDSPHDLTGNRLAILNRIAQNEIRTPREMSNDIDAELEAILIKAMATAPGDRYASAGEMADAIASYGDTRLSATVTTRVSTDAKPSAPRAGMPVPMMIALNALALVVVVGIVTALILSGNRNLPVEPDPGPIAKVPSPGKIPGTTPEKKNGKAPGKTPTVDPPKPPTVVKDGITGSGPLKVFILAGQTNMTGPAPISKLRTFLKGPGGESFNHLMTNDTWTLRRDVFLAARTMHARGMDVRNGFLKPGMGRARNEFGPALTFGHAVGMKLDNPILLIRVTFGGANLIKSARPPSSGGETGEYYKAIVNEVEKTLASRATLIPGLGSRSYDIAGLVWFQGWNDLQSPAPEQYETNLANLIRDPRKDLKAPDMKIVIGQFGQHGMTLPEGDGGRRVSLIRGGQKRVAESDEFKSTTRFVPTAPYLKPEPRTEGYLYSRDAEAFCRFGRCFGDAMLELLGEAPNDEPREERSILTSPDWTWTKPEMFTDVTLRDVNHTNPFITYDGLTFYFCVRHVDSNHRDLCVSRRTKLTHHFSAPVKVKGVNINTPRNEGSCVVSSNGLTMILVSNRDGGQGKADLWISKRASRTDKWQKPVNMGPEINSEEGEKLSWISHDDLSLIYCQKYDLYITRRASPDRPFGKPVRFGNAVNKRRIMAGWMSRDEKVLITTVTNDQGRANLWIFSRPSRNVPFGHGKEIGEMVNSPMIDGSPTFGPDGKTMYFHSTRDGLSRIFRTKRVKK